MQLARTVRQAVIPDQCVFIDRVTLMLLLAIHYLSWVDRWSDLVLGPALLLVFQLVRLPPPCEPSPLRLDNVVLGLSR